MDTERTHITDQIEVNNLRTRFGWYPYTGELAPLPLDDLEEEEEEEEEESDEEEDFQPDDIFNYWNYHR